MLYRQSNYQLPYQAPSAHRPGTHGLGEETESHEHPDTREIREALGAVAIGQAGVYWLYRGEDTNWRVHHEGDSAEKTYADREEALRALRLAVSRCSAYCLFVEGDDGRFTKEYFNWPREAA
jgi:hypothetical protein